MTNYLGGDETTLKASGVDTHDGEKELPSSVELVTDDFERASLGDDYVGNTGTAQIQSSVALQGSRSLQISRSSAGLSRIGTNDRPTLPQLGDSVNFKAQLTDTDDQFRVSMLVPDASIRAFSSTGIIFRLAVDTNKFIVQQFSGGGSVARTDENADLSSRLNETLTITVKMTTDRNATVLLTDSTGTELSSLTVAIDSRLPSSGGVQIEFDNPNSAPTAYFDGPFITRRTTEELSERKRGATETSKLETAGGVGAGPRELPENEPAGILADQGVTSDLSAGTDVGYGLQLNGERGLELRAEADGSGGVQNSVVDLSGLNSDLRLGTGQAIEDESGTGRINFASSTTAVGTGPLTAGEPRTLWRDGSFIRTFVPTDTPWGLFDDEGDFKAVEYTTSASAPGTLELSNSIISRPSSDTTTRTNITETSVGGLPRHSTSSSFKRNVGQTAVDIIDFAGNGMLAVVSGVGPDEGVDRFTDIITATRNSPVTVIESTENGAPPTRDYLKPQPGIVAISVSSGEVQVGAYTIRSSHPP